MAGGVVVDKFTSDRNTSKYLYGRETYVASKVPSYQGARGGESCMAVLFF